MKKWFGLLLIELMGCAGRPERGYFPVASRPISAAAPGASRDTVQTFTARATASSAPAPSASPSASAPMPRLTRPARPLRLMPARRVRRLGRRMAPVLQTQNAQAPASHAADGLGKLLLVAAIAAALLLVAVIIAFTAPATVLGAIGKVLLWGLGGVLLVTLLNGLEQALFPDQRR